MFGVNVTTATQSETSSTTQSLSVPIADVSSTSNIEEQRFRTIQQEIMAIIAPSVVVTLSPEELEERTFEAVGSIAARQQFPIGGIEQRNISQRLVDEMLGLGPLQVLMDDPEITDIMVNGHKEVFIELRGKVKRADVSFRDEEHVLNLARRIVSRIGRRVDETTPMVDARLPNGSRVNVLIPPLALNGTCISIRKFNEKKHSLEQLSALGAMSTEMASVLNIIARSRINVLISGGTGAGKTTLLNALSFGISPDERIITIEDAAELKLQQPHVVSIETRPSSVEGAPAIGQRELLRNALRMRPDRIILGEVRGAEAFDMMQAMNTGHDGSMSTLHANSPHDALIRLENMLLMAEVNLPVSALRRQIASTLDVIVQVERMRDGKRRIVNITEIVGLEGDQYLTHDLFHFDYQHTDAHGDIVGQFLSAKILPRFSEKARYYQLESQLKQALGVR
ncbi:MULTISPECIES: CpaF family protein [unclassified Moritella]|uniref:CpaF family protein n=1 Tax=unclassified Moritella TaxID=2637987 RepID=UPI001BA9EA09|nr:MULTISPECIES: CpaF family protein [unclassified Moritella]QUM84534.1 CpaF family protein [Moritella sp. 28]QUM88793.1 CpaF family protein [Moritella sp. 36]